MSSTAPQEELMLALLSAINDEKLAVVQEIRTWYAPYRADLAAIAIINSYVDQASIEINKAPYKESKRHPPDMLYKISSWRDRISAHLQKAGSNPGKKI